MIYINNTHCCHKNTTLRRYSLSYGSGLVVTQLLDGRVAQAF